MRNMFTLQYSTSFTFVSDIPVLGGEHTRAKVLVTLILIFIIVIYFTFCNQSQRASRRLKQKQSEMLL